LTNATITFFATAVRAVRIEKEDHAMARVRFDRITTNPRRLQGQPCIRDLRITVRRVLEALATYPDRQELKREYPELDDEDIRQALAFAATCLDDKVLETAGSP
jgi:uncharacterized protein (DUF433 family)